MPSRRKARKSANQRLRSIQDQNAAMALGTKRDLEERLADEKLRRKMAVADAGQLRLRVAELMERVGELENKLWASKIGDTE